MKALVKVVAVFVLFAPWFWLHVFSFFERKKKVSSKKLLDESVNKILAK